MEEVSGLYCLPKVTISHLSSLSLWKCISPRSSSDQQLKVGVTIYLQRLLLTLYLHVLTTEEKEQERTTLMYKTVCVYS